MTPKEKAFELAHKFRLIDIRTSESTTMMISMTDAKQCALIAVDEILKVALFYNDSQAEIPYWDEVKQEIENL
jgi:hypothetical protein